MGAGAYGKVYKVRHKQSGNLYAIKVISKEAILKEKMLPQLRREVRIMYSLNHPNVIKLINHFEDTQNFYLIMELAENGTLFKKIRSFGRFDEAMAAQYLREVAIAV